jgi:hypothetical protein
MKRFCSLSKVSLLSSALAFALLGSRAAYAQELASAHIQIEDASGGMPGPITGPAAEAILQGPLSSDPVELAVLKAEAAREAGVASPPEAGPLPAAATPAPGILLGKSGVFDSGSTPSDSTGAIGTGRLYRTGQFRDRDIRSQSQLNQT